MKLSRRAFLAAALGAAAAPDRLIAELPTRGLPASRTAGGEVPRAVRDRFDPWIEVDRAALLDNAAILARLAGGRPILAVVKNNAYGAGYAEAARVLEASPHVEGFGVVKTAAAHALRDAGVGKPILLMARFDPEDGPDLARRDVAFALPTDDAPRLAAEAARAAGREVGVHFYLDTGMGRMGVPAHRALPWILDAQTTPGLRIESTFMGFTEDEDFDREQLRRLREVAEAARAEGARVGRLHAASSHAVFNFPDSHLDLVRPGISLYGAYPTDRGAEREIAELRPALRLRARVVRVERLRTGDGVSYGRNYVADRPVWTATLPVGHTDGYPRRAVDGARVLIGDRLYPVIGAVSASHCIVELGDEPSASVGDVATFLGPDHPEIHPNALATTTGTSVYDRLMHLNPTLPRVLV